MARELIESVIDLSNIDEIGDCSNVYDHCKDCVIMQLRPQHRERVARAIEDVSEEFLAFSSAGTTNKVDAQRTLTDLCRIAVGGIENITESTIVFTAVSMKQAGECTIPENE